METRCQMPSGAQDYKGELFQIPLILYWGALGSDSCLGFRHPVQQLCLSSGVTLIVAADSLTEP